MSKVAILTDSSCDLTKSQAEMLDINVLRMPVTVDGVEYIDEETITREEIIVALKEDKDVHTAQVPLGKVFETYKNLLKEYDEILHLPISSGLSGSYQTSLAVANDFDGKVTVVDTKHACYPQALLCIYARKMLEDGLSVKEVKERIENDGELFAVIIPENLKYLKKGGRISPSAAALGTMLQIIPLLSVKDGVIDVIDKVRTHRKALLNAINVICDVENPKDYEWYVIHDGHTEVDEYREIIKEKIGEPVGEAHFGPIILSHVGPGCIGLGHIKKLHD